MPKVSKQKKERNVTVTSSVLKDPNFTYADLANLDDEQVVSIFEQLPFYSELYKHGLIMAKTLFEKSDPFHEYLRNRNERPKQVVDPSIFDGLTKLQAAQKQKEIDRKRQEIRQRISNVIQLDKRLFSETHQTKRKEYLKLVFISE